MTVQNFPTVQDFLDKLKAEWSLANPKISSWIAVPYDYLVKAFQFMLANMDAAVQLVEELDQPGVNKKLIVLDLVGQLFDFMIFQSLPTWLKPFAPMMRKILVDVIAANLIDFIVSKYNAGSWSK